MSADNPNNGQFVFFLRAALASTASTVVVLITGLMKGKVNALLLGVEGIGTVAQIVTFQSALTGLTSVGLAFAVTKYTAEYRASGNPDGLRRAFWLPVLIVFILSSIAVVVVWVFASPLAMGLLLDANLSTFVILGALATPFVALGTILNGLITGYRDNRLYAGASILVSVLSLPLVVGLVWAWGIAGSLLSLCLVNLIQVVLTLYWLRRRHSELFSFEITTLLGPESWSVLRTMFTIGGLSLLMGINLTLVKLITRTVTIHSLGIEANGLYQGAVSISGQVVPMALGFLSLYAFPKVSETRDPDSVNVVTNETVRFTLLVMTLAATAILLFRSQIIRLLLSDSFLPANSLVPAQVWGDVFYAIGTAIQIGILSVGPLYFFAILGMSIYWGQLPAFFLFLPFVGVAALPYSYLAGTFFYLVFCLVAMRKYSGFRLSKGNLLLMARSGSLMLLATFFANVSWQITLLLLFIGGGWLLSFPTTHEREVVRRWVMRLLRRGEVT